jgi:hypothetical protein
MPAVPAEGRLPGRLRRPAVRPLRLAAAVGGRRRGKRRPDREQLPELLPQPAK